MIGRKMVVCSHLLKTSRLAQRTFYHSLKPSNLSSHSLLSQRNSSKLVPTYSIHHLRLEPLITKRYLLNFWKKPKEPSLIESGNLRPPAGWKPKWRWLLQLTHEIGYRIWTGSKELWRNTMQARILKKKLKLGEQLNRHQIRFIKRNTKDLRNLIPFFLVWRIPIFGDFLLPFFVSTFPGLLPSTIKLSRQPTLAEKIHHARLKQRSLLEHARNNENIITLNEVVEHMIKMNEIVSSQLIIQHKDLLQENFKLEMLSYSQLAALCSVFNLGTRGPTFYLRMRFNNYFEELLSDDKMIQNEGVETLTKDELVDACFERGLKVLEVDDDIKRKQISEWLALSLNYPTVLHSFLIYAHAFVQRDFLLLPEPIEQ